MRKLNCTIDNTPHITTITEFILMFQLSMVLVASASSSNISMFIEGDLS